jgi:gamma-glutamyl:cysteine ligase YbdK (ATP-grasp superfamily)
MSRTCAVSFRSSAQAGLEIVAAGTHPFSHWQDQKIFENARYEYLALLAEYRSQLKHSEND